MRTMVPQPPFWGASVVGPGELQLGTVLQYVNKKALFRLQWQYKQGKRTEEVYKKFVTEFVEPRFKEWQRRVQQDHAGAPRRLRLVALLRRAQLAGRARSQGSCARTLPL